MIAAEEISKAIKESPYFQRLFKKCMEFSYSETLGLDQEVSDYTEKEYRDLLRFADLLSSSTDSLSRNYAYKIITYLNSHYRNDPYYRTISKSVYYNLGNFPAVRYLAQTDENQAELPFDRMLQVEAKKLIQAVSDNEGIYFTDTQYNLFSKLSDSHEFSFSGPTSMGKSFIIKAFISKIMQNTPPENMVIVVPSRALINQFAIEIHKELGQQLQRFNYKVFTNSNVSELVLEANVKLILVLTPERLLSYLSQNENPPIGFLFVDEAHKIAQDDTRSITSYVAIEKTLKKYPDAKLYFSSPNVSNPEVLLKLFQRGGQNHFQTDETTVAQNMFLADLDNQTLSYLYESEFKHISATIPQSAATVNGFLTTFGKESNLVYCNSPDLTILYAKEFADTMDVCNNADLRTASSVIKQYVHRDYYLVELVKKGVAYHFGNMPQLIRNLIEKLYRNGDIRYVFCTSTLLEGVNMPTQNLFILNNKQGLKVLKSIDFWNLAGRAGRMTKELQGNVFCVKHSKCEWEDITFFSNKKIELVPTVYERLNSKLRSIEKQIRSGEIRSGSEEEKNILRYIANIICIDSMQLNTDYHSPIISLLIENNKETIIELAKERTHNITIPHSLLNSNESIDIKIQNSVYQQIRHKHDNDENIKFPRDVNYDSCLNLLRFFHCLYRWENSVKELQNINSMKYYALLMSRWINDESLKQIITESIQYHSDNSTEMWFSFREKETFDKDNKKHVNKLIGDIIKDIENILRFQFEKYFNHYYMVINHILGEQNAGENWASLLEYGTRNKIIIALQNVGLSRHSAYEIYKNHRNALSIENGQLKSINKERLLNELERNTLEYEEVHSAL